MNPVTIDAVQLTWKTWSDVCDFLGDIVSPSNPGRLIDASEVADTCGEPGPHFIALDIPTLEGRKTAVHGDWIIRSISGEHRVCKPDVSSEVYEAVAP